MFQNEYEPENPLQRIYESTFSGGCLCSMRESCGVCLGFSERNKQQELIKEIARAQGYQLYFKRWTSGKYIHVKLNMEGL